MSFSFVLLRLLVAVSSLSSRLLDSILHRTYKLSLVFNLFSFYTPRLHICLVIFSY